MRIFLELFAFIGGVLSFASALGRYMLRKRKDVLKRKGESHNEYVGRLQRENSELDRLRRQFDEEGRHV